MRKALWGMLYWATLFLSRLALVLVAALAAFMLGKVILPLTVYQWLFR